jgi:hypothetical protein
MHVANAHNITPEYLALESANYLNRIVTANILDDSTRDAIRRNLDHLEIVAPSLNLDTAEKAIIDAALENAKAFVG